MTSGYYDITNKTLGRGHYGVVKLGRHSLTGEPVAIKVIEKSKLNNDSLNQLGTEIRILFRLSEYEHPNILKLYQTIDTEDKLYLVTEYCGPLACDLHDYLLRKHSRNGLNEKEAQIFFVQICNAISYCHSMGIVHRDLKPENILVTDYRHVHVNQPPVADVANNPIPPASHEQLQYPLLKLIDFGFANQWYPDEMMRTSCGTLAYSAPELLLGEPYDGTKVDVWGLGLMLYILLYGDNPFMQINDNETLTKILDCSFATPTKYNVDYDAIELLRSLIKRNPETRLPIEAILRHKWFATIPKPLELSLKYQIKSEQSHCSSKQSPRVNQTVASPTLPSISESGPLKNLNRSVDDDDLVPSRTKSGSGGGDNTTGCGGVTTTSENNNANYNRTRSLSITRPHLEPVQEQEQSLPQTKSSHQLERLNQSAMMMSSPLPRATGSSPLYRPTSPDVGGNVSLSEEELELHELVIQELLRLAKLKDSKSSIEASLKSARYSHRLFNQSSIKPAAQFPGRSNNRSGMIRTLLQAKGVGGGGGNANTGGGASGSAASGGDVEQAITAVNNDDYIYATYQLTRDRIIRVRQGQTNRGGGGAGASNNKLEATNASNAANNQELVPEKDLHGHHQQQHQHQSLSAATFALPLARKCSLVSEESVCSTDLGE